MVSLVIIYIVGSEFLVASPLDVGMDLFGVIVYFLVLSNVLSLALNNKN